MAEQEKLNPKKRGLGRGLDALFESGAPVEEEDANPNAPEAPNSSQPGRKYVTIEQLQPNPLQPRKGFDTGALDELASSLKQHGLLQPILVRPLLEDDKYEIIAGERRWRAAQRAQLHEVPVIIQAFTDAEALQIGLVENLQREDLNPVEETEGYQSLIDDHGYKVAEIGDLVGKSRSYVANMIRLTGLPDTVKTMLSDNQISTGHARALLGAEAPENLAKRIINEGLSVRQVESLIAETRDTNNSRSSDKPVSRETRKSPPSQKDADTRALEDELSQKLGMDVSIGLGRDHHSGQLQISFKSLDQLDYLLERLKS